MLKTNDKTPQQKSGSFQTNIYFGYIHNKPEISLYSVFLGISC